MKCQPSSPARRQHPEGVLPGLGWVPGVFQVCFQLWEPPAQMVCETLLAFWWPLCDVPPDLVLTVAAEGWRQPALAPEQAQ